MSILGMPEFQNVRLSKCHTFKMSGFQNVGLSKCHFPNFRLSETSDFQLQEPCHIERKIGHQIENDRNFPAIKTWLYNHCCQKCSYWQLFWDFWSIYQVSSNIGPLNELFYLVYRIDEFYIIKSAVISLALSVLSLLTMVKPGFAWFYHS